mmetsp:Transcript_2005/g.4033  ORF Transcript_2005/g.4033 Transcript_2005/m.4033 type:complete len:92 (-) Transcript_2005:257-532(-)
MVQWMKKQIIVITTLRTPSCGSYGRLHSCPNPTSLFVQKEVIGFSNLFNALYTPFATTATAAGITKAPITSPTYATGKKSLATTMIATPTT